MVRRKIFKIAQLADLSEADTLANSVIVAYPVSRVDKEVFKKVVYALNNKLAMKVLYKSPYENEPPSRYHVFSPWFIYFKYRAWYVWGKSDQYAKSSSFRISRMKLVELLSNGQYVNPPGDISMEETVYSENPFSRKKFKFILRIREPFASSVKDVKIGFPINKYFPKMMVPYCFLLRRLIWKRSLVGFYLR